MGLCLLIDIVNGYQGWSINYVIPAIILVAYLAIMILMIVNFMNWQSYILFQFTLVIFSMILMGLYLLHIITKPILSYVTVGITLVIFIGTIVFGDKKAKTELIRRFHI
jgi:predicted neutral ceramidase superfamily lipid hydrolase